MEIYEKLQNIVESILGSPRREYPGGGGWFEYNCPHCTEENFGEPDNKYNLAVNYEEGYCHCWRCFYSTKISKVVKQYGSAENFNEYKNEVSRIKEAFYYQIQAGEFIIHDDPVELEPLTLPNCNDPHDGTNDGNKALSYLYGRGVDDYIIEKHNIKYVGNEWNSAYRNMIIIPSYDEFGDLNYFTGRDFTGKKNFNKKNPDIAKTEIIFDIGMVNWYEPITIVEGPFDHIVVPNSIPLLGKAMKAEDMIYHTLCHKAKHNINIMLDADAESSALKLYQLLNNGVMFDRIRVVKCPDKMDPSDVYKVYGRKGILALLSNARKVDDLTLAKAELQNSLYSRRGSTSHGGSQPAVDYYRQ